MQYFRLNNITERLNKVYWTLAFIVAKIAIRRIFKVAATFCLEVGRFSLFNFELDQNLLVFLSLAYFELL